MTEPNPQTRRWNYSRISAEFLRGYSFDSGSGISAEWIVYLLFHVHFSVTTHTASIWLCVLLAVFRYVHVRPSSSSSSGGGQRLNIGRQRAALRKVKAAVASVCFTSVVLMTPNYLSLAVRQRDDDVSMTSQSRESWLSQSVELSVDYWSVQLTRTRYETIIIVGGYVHLPFSPMRGSIRKNLSTNIVILIHVK